MMAERRMFTQKIVDSDAFLDMPLSTQSLYFHLNMRADDDGFVNNPKKIQRMIGASEDDLKLLIAKRFILAFENGVIVIKHWRMHNLLRKDRYTQTQYVEQLDRLEVKENGAYTEKPAEIPCGNHLATTWQPDGNQMATQYSIGKDSKGKESIVEDSIDNNPDSKPNRKAAKKTLYFPLDEQLNSTFLDFIEMRKKIKSPMTERAITLMLNKIDRLAGTDSVLAINILEQSIMNGWKDVYPLKDNKNNTRSSGEIDWSKV